MHIAEVRKEKAEQTGEGMNPYEALFETESGEYYMARLLNMPHLEEESEFMKNCVGASDSYINRIKKGDIEILSFRHTPKFNQETQMLDIDKPILTIEYDLKTKTINQIKGYDDKYLTGDEPYFKDALEALGNLKASETDKGEKREIKEIASSETQNIHVDDYHLYTEKGPIHFEEYNEQEHGFILKQGNMPITKDTPKDFAVKIFKFIEGVDIQEEELVTNVQEISEDTKVYIGPWNPHIYNQIKNYPNITHLYESFPGEKIFTYELATDPTIQSAAQAKEKLTEKGIYISEYGDDLLDKTEFSKEQQTYKLAQFTVEQLGLPQRATTDEIYSKAQELGLQLCPAEVGPQLRLSYEGKDWKYIAMKQITDRRGYLNVFCLGADAARLKLDGDEAKPGFRWVADYRFVFLAS